MTDPISDLLTRIRNGGMARKHSIDVPHSQIKEGIAEVLREEGFIVGYSVEQAESPPTAKLIRIQLKYHNNKLSIVSLRRVSLPSRRVYRSCEKLNEFAHDPYSVTIVSTPGGVMSYRHALRRRLGGEVLCVIT